MILTKLYGGEHKAEAPGDHDLEVINRYALEPRTAEDVFIGRVKLCNDQYDKSHERFTKEILERFAETAPGKPVLRGHNTKQEPAGRWFDAEVIRDAAGVHHVVARYFLAASDPLTEKVKAGIVKDVSIGATAVQRTCDVCGENFDTDACKHFPGREYEGKLCTLTYSGDPSGYATKEGSFVVEGCQYGAETIRSIEEAVETGMELTASTLTTLKQVRLNTERISNAFTAQILDGTNARGDPMPEKDEAAAVPEGLTAEKAVALTSERDELKKWKAESETLVADGQAYRKRLGAEISRLAGITGLEEFAAFPLATIDTAKIADLEAAEQKLLKKQNEMFPPKGDGIPADPKHDIPPAVPEKFDPHRPSRAFWRTS